MQLTICGKKTLKMYKKSNFSDLLEKHFVGIVFTQGEVEGCDHSSQLNDKGRALINTLLIVN